MYVYNHDRQPSASIREVSLVTYDETLWLHKAFRISSGWSLSLRDGIYIISVALGILQKGVGNKGCKMSSYEQYRGISVRNSQLRMTALGVHKNGPIDSPARMEKGLKGPDSLLLNSFLWTDSGNWGIIVLSCTPTGDPSRFQWIVLTQSKHIHPDKSK